MRSLSELMSLSAEADAEEDSKEETKAEELKEEQEKKEKKEKKGTEVWPPWRQETRGVLARRVACSIPKEELRKGSSARDPGLAWKHLVPLSRFEGKGPAVRNRRLKHKTMTTLRRAAFAVLNAQPQSASARAGVIALVRNTNGYDPLTVWAAAIVLRHGPPSECVLLADWLEALAMTAKWPRSLHTTNRGRLPTSEERAFLLSMAIAQQIDLGCLEYGTSLLSKAATSHLSGTHINLASALCEISRVFGPVPSALEVMVSTLKHQDIISRIIQHIETKDLIEDDASLAVTRTIEAHEAALIDPNTLDTISAIAATAIAATLVHKGLGTSQKSTLELLHARLALRDQCIVTRRMLMRFAEPGNLAPLHAWLQLQVNDQEYDLQSFDDQDLIPLQPSPLAMLYATFFGYRSYYDEHAPTLWNNILSLQLSEPSQPVDFSTFGEKPKKIFVRHFFNELPKLPVFEHVVTQRLPPDALTAHERILVIDHDIPSELCVLTVRGLLAAFLDISPKFSKRVRSILKVHLARDPSDTSRRYCRAALAIFPEPQASTNPQQPIASNGSIEETASVGTKRRHSQIEEATDHTTTSSDNLGPDPKRQCSHHADTAHSAAQQQSPHLHPLGNSMGKISSRLEL